MRAEQEVFAALSVASPVVALVGAKIYPDQGPQDTDLPLVIFERTGTEAISTIHNEGPPVASKVTISTSSWAISRLVAEQIADQVQIALSAVGRTINRFSHFDPTSGAYAAVVDFDVWET